MKEKTVEYLKEKGYNAALEDMQIVIYVDHFLSKEEHGKLAKEIEESGYRASWGWKLKKSLKNPN